MARNAILEELYAVREGLLAEYEGDVHAYILDARQRALASGRPIVAPGSQSGFRDADTLVAATEPQPSVASDR